jgi:hypothetical protein
MNIQISKALRAVCAAVLLLVISLLCGGCSGINATKSISPLDFLLPGIMKNDAPSQPQPTNATLCLQRQPDTDRWDLQQAVQFGGDLITSQ